MTSSDKASIREVYELIERLEEKIDARFNVLENNHLNHISKNIKMLCMRVRHVENKLWYFTGGLAVFMAIIGLFLEYAKG